MKKNVKYDLREGEQAIVYEVLLPKKHGKQLRSVLDGFLAERELRKFPQVKKLLSSLDPPEQTAVLRSFMSVVRGYSMYEVSGRFSGPKGVVNEKSIVVRIIIPNPNGDARVQKLASTVVHFYLTSRFAEELGIEDEVWYMEYPTTLNRWVRVRD